MPHPKKGECRNTGRTRFKKGHTVSKEMRSKIGIARSGRKASKETREKLRQANLGKKHSKETCEKMSKNSKGKNSGEKCHLWKGGISKNKEYRNWQKNGRNRTKRMQNKNGSFHTFGEWENLKAQYNWTCPICKKSEPQIKLTEDHIIPLSRGGSDNIENIQPLCKRCNCSKGNRLTSTKTREISD